MNTQTRTERKLIAMLTENTGSHFLDSGGAYGRNWERNQKLGTDRKTWNARPTVIVSHSGDELSLTIDTYQFLRDRLIYDSFCHALTISLHALGNGAMSSESWPETLEAFCELNNLMTTNCCNTYNGECLLSQTLQFWQIEEKPPAGHQIGDSMCAGDIIALQIHGGCDVRGGYTAPVFFRLKDDHGIYDYNNLYCNVEPLVKYDPKQLEIDPTLPRDYGLKLYTDDGYHWYNDANGENGQESGFIWDTEKDCAVWNGRKCEFYV